MNRKLIIYIAEITVGAVLAICAFAGLLDEFWSGLGIGLAVVGGLQLARNIKYRTNEQYREKMDIETKDERNKYISMKAWSWTGYIFVILAGIATIVFKILGMDDLVKAASLSVCVIVFTYWISYMVLNKKY